MIFSNFSKSINDTSIVFKNISPVKNAKTIKFFKDDSSGTFLKKEFRWSYNNDYWSSWAILNQGNLSSISITGVNLFLEIKYSIAGSSSKVNNFNIDYVQNIPSRQSIKDCTIKTDNPSGTCDAPTSTFVPDYGGTKTTSVITTTNADTLNCKSSEYYLWRPNHKGQQPISSIINLEKIIGDLYRSVDASGAIIDALNMSSTGIGVYHNKANNKLYFKTLEEGNKILLSEDDNGHIIISVDDASINELYTLIGNLEGTNIGIPSYGAYGQVYKSKLNDKLQFRTIVSGNANVVVATVGDQIRISLDASASGESVWTDPDPISADVGGISNGMVISPSENTNSIDILEQILYEYIPPKIINLLPQSTYYEKYVDQVTIDITGAFDNSKSSKTDVSTASLLINGSYSPSFPSFSYPLDSSYGEFNWTIPGEPNYDNRVFNIRLVNTFEKNNIRNLKPDVDASIFINYINPYFVGIVGNSIDINNISSNDITSLNKLIVPEQSNTIDFDISTNLVKIKFVYAYDATYGDLKNILDVKNNFIVTSSFDKGLVNINNGVGTNIPYKVYIKHHWINFPQEVSKFKITFDI